MAPPMEGGSGAGPTKLGWVRTIWGRGPRGPGPVERGVGRGLRAEVGGRQGGALLQGRGFQGGAGQAGAGPTGPGRSSPEARRRTSLLHRECWSTSRGSLGPGVLSARLLLPPGCPPPPPPLYNVPDAQAEDAGVIAPASPRAPSHRRPRGGAPRMELA